MRFQERLDVHRFVIRSGQCGLVVDGRCECDCFDARLHGDDGDACIKHELCVELHCGDAEAVKVFAAAGELQF